MTTKSSHSGSRHRGPVSANSGQMYGEFYMTEAASETTSVRGAYSVANR